MKISLPLQIALHFKQGQKKNNMLSLISFISTIAIALGVTVIIVALSAINGFERELNNRILAIVPHGEIEVVNPPFIDWQGIMKRIEEIPGICAAAPYLNFTGLVERNGNLQAIQVKGIDPRLEIRLSMLPHYVQDSAWERLQSGQKQIILGKKIATRLKIKSGDWLTLMIPNISPKMKLLQPKRIRLQVIGILALNSQLDHSLGLIPLLDAQNYLQRDKDVEGIAIKVSDIFNADKIVHYAGEVTNTYVKVRSWIYTYGYMYRDIQMVRVILYLVMVLMIGIACFSIVSTLVMAVKDKSSDIAILRTLGGRNDLICIIFILYALLISLSGSIYGALIGILITFSLAPFIKVIEQLLGQQLLSSNIYFIDFLPTELQWTDVMNVLITTLLLSLLASWYPAWRANNINPVKVLSR